MASVLGKQLAKAVSTDATGVITVGQEELLSKDVNFIGSLLIENADVDVKEITSIVAVADVSSSLDGTYFILQDDVGSVAFWIDVDNSGTTIPAGASAADRAVEITTIAANDPIGTVGTAVYNAVVADSKFEAGSDDTAGNLLIQASTVGIKTDGADGDTGFTIAESVAGVNALAGLVVKIQHSPDRSNWEDLITFTTATADGFESVQIDNTNVHVFRHVRANVTAISAGSADLTCILHYDRV